jgi:hypothetical protein
VYLQQNSGGAGTVLGALRELLVPTVHAAESIQQKPTPAQTLTLQAPPIKTSFAVWATFVALAITMLSYLVRPFKGSKKYFWFAREGGESL